MALALRLARRGRRTTNPNPMVGAVVVSGDEIVGRGFHQRAGQPHAELLALQQAGRRARGGELIINLEPCCHQGRTPPCTEAIIAAGIRRAVVGMIDPDPRVNGRGVEALRAAGIEVVVGVRGQQCVALNEAFAHHVTHRRPLVTLKSAITLDGRVATRSGHSRWVTGESARRRGHRLRDRHDAIVVGVGTVLADDPQLTCRGVPGGRDPVRVVVDSRLRTTPDARVVRATAGSEAPTWLITSSGSDPRRVEAMRAAGAEVLEVESTADGGDDLDLHAVLRELSRRSILSVLVEGGPRLAGAFWRAQLVDRMVLFIAPKVIGDSQALPMIDGPAVATLDQARDLRDVKVGRAGEDLVVEGRVVW